MAITITTMRTSIKLGIVAAGVALLSIGTLHHASANQSGPAVNDDSIFQIRMCGALGGTATVEEYRTPGSGLANVRVRCHGGLLDGMDCDNFPILDSAYCSFPLTQPDEEAAVAPTVGVHVDEPVIEVAPVVDESVEPVVLDDADATDNDGDPVTEPQPLADAEAPMDDAVADGGAAVDQSVVDDGSMISSTDVSSGAIFEIIAADEP